MEPDPRPDVELLRRFRQEGDRAALSTLFERHRSLAYRVALRVAGNRTDAEDAAQDAFVRLLAYAPRVHSEDSLAGLISCMAYRAAQDVIRSDSRRHAREVSAAGVDETPPVADLLAAREEKRAVHQAVEALDDRYRLPVLLRYFEELSTEEVAQALGISRTAVTTRLSRALAKLRDRLQREGVVVSIPALLLALEETRPADAAPASLAARLEVLVASTPAPAATGVGAAALAGGALKAKLAATALVVAVSLGGVATVRRLPPPPDAGAATGTRVPAAQIHAPRSAARETPPARQSDAGTTAVATPSSRLSAPRAASQAGDPEPRRTPDAFGARPPKTPPALAGGSSHSQLLRDGHSKTPPALAGGSSHSQLLRDGHSKTPPASAGGSSHKQLPGRRLSATPPALAGGSSHGKLPPEAGPHPESRIAAADSQPSPGPPPPMTREEELRLAKEVIPELWNDPAGGQQVALLATLARVDPAEAERLVATLPEAQQAEARQRILWGQLLADPEGTLEQIQEVPPDSYWAVSALRTLVARRSPVAPTLLDRAIRGIEQGPVEKVATYYLASVAAIAERLRDPRAPALVAALLRRTRDLYQQAKQDAGKMRAFRDAVQGLTRLVPEEALRLSEILPGTRERQWLWADAVAATARRDPARARALLDERKGYLDEGPNGVLQWSMAARRVVVALADRDVAQAGVLARRIPDERESARALLEVSRRLPEERAASLRREAIAAASEAFGAGDWDSVLRFAEVMPPGPERRYTCALALQMAGVSQAWMNSEGRAPQVAVLLAEEDPEAARALLEDGIENHDEERNPGLHRMWAAQAMVLVDPRRAVEVARGIEPAGRRVPALSNIASCLVEPRETRAHATGILRYGRGEDDDVRW